MAQKKIWSVDEVRTLVSTNATMVERSLVKLYECQTAEEQNFKSTHVLNHQGFNKVDAKFGTNLAQVVKNGYHLSPKQLEASRKILRKYVRQLTLIANNGVLSAEDKYREKKGRTSPSFGTHIAQASLGLDL